MNLFRKYTMILCGIALIGSSCSNLDESGFKVDDSSVIYSETFATTMGSFKAVSVTGDQTWTMSSNSYISMSGYRSSDKTNHANEDWLISADIDLTKVTQSYLSFDYVAHLMGNVTTEATVWVSENYKTDSLPRTASWDSIPAKLIDDPGNYVFTSSGQLSLDKYAGKKIRIAIKYISTDAKAGTFELKNFLVTRGAAAADKSNDGTELKPYTVAEGMLHQTGGNAWITGYIVGYLWTGTSSTNYIIGSDTCTQATNLLIADSSKVEYFARTIPVQLPSGVVRDGLNLPANKSLIGHKVTMYGALTSYFSVPGLKTVTYYKLDNGTSGGTKPVVPIYSETFASNSQGRFTINNVNLPAGVSAIWTTTSSYGMKGTAFVSNVNYASESWLISPEVDLSKETSAKLRFDHAINFVTVANMKSEMAVLISVDNGVNWSSLTVPTYPTGTNWTFVNSGEIDLSQYLGQKIKIAFKYSSTSTKAGTWEVKNVLIYKPAM